MIFLLSSMIASMMLADTPLLMGLWLLLTTLMMTITLNMFTVSWFSFLMFLIYISGMMILFAYFSAMQPNQSMSISHILLPNFLMFTLLVLSIPFPFNLPLFLFSPSKTLAETLMLHQNTSIYLMMVLILLLTLISVIKIATKNLGPLRPFK